MGFKPRKKNIPKLSANQLAVFWSQPNATFEKRCNLSPEEIKELDLKKKKQ